MNAFVAPKAVKVVDHGTSGMKNMFLSMATAQERERLTARINQIKVLMDQVTGAKRDEVKKQIEVYETHLRMLDEKTKELQSHKSDSQPDAKPTHMYGSKICELALKLRDEFFDNEAFLGDINKAHPQMLGLMGRLKALARTLHSEASESIFDPEVA